ncbi:MAG: ATP-dependent helicase [Ferruginibacter sp.]|nr:ATP-dependent helicase [Chitinophagaceae bacterium]
MSFNKERLENKFREEYDRLNEKQRLAVDTIEGPVIVNAGPGTGKTQILAFRIATILQQTDTAPNNILCLTYTDNGAIEMRNRLIKIIGSAAYKIQIHTFHSFCNEVIQDNLTYFGKLNLEPIGDLEEIDLFYKLIDSIEKNNPLKRFRGEVYYEKDRLKALYSLVKKEAWTPAYLNERIDAYVAELPTKEGFFYKKKYKEFVAGDPKPAAIREETAKMEMLRAAVNLYPRYNKMMADAGRYNFDDMILWVLDAFTNNEDILLDYQERFLYFLVDEFQDTSRSQSLLLQHLTGYWEVPNVFVVGDADQSIFSFQDANVENIIEFEKKYTPQVTKINLDKNYRSTQHLLNTVQRLITNNTLRTVLPENDKPLLSANESLQGISVEPAINEYANTAQEAIDVALQIEALIQQGISGKEIAVIYRNHFQVAEITSLLEVKKIPVNAKKKMDLLQIPFINNMINLLTWIDKEKYVPYSADDILFQLLHCDFFKLSPLEIAKLSITTNEKNRASRTEVFSIRRLLAESPAPAADLFNPSTGHSAKEISATLEMLLKESANSTLQHLIELMIQKAGVLSFVIQSPEKPWLMQVLNAFFSFIKEENKRQPELTLHQLLVNIDTMRKNRLGIPLHKVTATEEGVNMITAHGSKGSEFAHVFIIGCTKDIWDETNAGNSRTYKLPDNLISNTNIATSLEESRRLFYVALTRAKTHLHISYPLKNIKDKDQVKSSFVTELTENSELQAIPKKVPDALLTDYLALQFAEKAKPEIALVEEEYLNLLLKKYTLSVTHLSNYLNCPLKFYYQNLVRVPAAKNENMAFGSAAHYAVEMLFKKMKKANNVFPPRRELVDDFTFYMHTNREAFTPEQYKRRLEYGEKILPAYYDNYIDKWSKIVIAEKLIRGIVVQNVPINGKLDKLEFNGKAVNVVDYKTGKYENAKKKLAPPHDKEPNGSDYWRQAVFYKILLDNDTSNDWEAVSTEFDFLEPVEDEYKIEKIIITPADITTVTQQIITTWEKIQNKEFKTGCGKPDCEWCNFVKSNNLAVTLHPPDEEEHDSIGPVTDLL